MSPQISISSRMNPSQDFLEGGATGTISATGFPKRVMRTGFPVRRTFSKTPRHVALNLEIAISCIFNLYHGQRLWSNFTTAPSAPRGTAGLNPIRFPYNQRKVISRGTRIDVYA